MSRKNPNPKSEPVHSSNQQRDTAIALVALALLLAIVALLRLRVLDLPLERDEGEYAYVGQLIRDGVAPYLTAYNMKWPGTYLAYAAIMTIFGESVQGIRVGLMLVASASAVMLFVLARRMWGNGAAVAAAAAQLLLSVSVESMGLFGHATHFVAFFAIAGFLLVTGKHRPAALAAGVAFALAALMKQPGIFFGFAAAAWLARMRRWRDLALLAGGAVATIAAVIGWLFAAGAFDRFWFWTFTYAREYGTRVTAAMSMNELRYTLGGIVMAAPLLWMLVLAGLASLRVPSRMEHANSLAAAFFAAGVLSTIPGWAFREHYFLSLFPAASLMAALAVHAFASRAPRMAAAPYVAAGVFALALITGIVHQWNLTDTADMTALSRRIYGPNPFPEAKVIADYIRSETSTNDTVAILGSEPQIYFYSGRRAATGYIYTYPLMEPHPYASTMQREMIAEIEKANPKFMVIVNVQQSWLGHEKSDQTIVDWMWSGFDRGWRVDGVADIRESGTTYTFGPEAASSRPTTKNFVLLLRRG